MGGWEDNSISKALEFWNEKYEQALTECTCLTDLRGVFVAYNTNIDAIKYVDEEFANFLIGAAASRREDAAKNATETDAAKANAANENENAAADGDGNTAGETILPQKIRTVPDLLAGIRASMRKGKALQLVLDDESGIADWLDENVEPEERRMGGQAGITANLLSILGLNRVIIYTPLLPKRQAELFVKNDNLLVPHFDNDTLDFKKPMDAFKPDDNAKVNWIFEYNVGARLENIVAPRANRFIAAARPDALKLHKERKILEHAKEIAETVDCVIFSGLQITKHTYKDGTMYYKYIREAADLAESLRKARPDLKLHLEFASIRDEAIRGEIIRTFAPKVHSLGINEVEIVDALETLGDTDLAHNIKVKESPVSLYEGMKRVMERTGIQRTHLHSLGHYIAVTHNDYGIDIEHTLLALLYSSTLGAAKAKLGEITKHDDIHAGLDVPPSQIGIRQLRELKKHIESIGGSTNGGTGTDGNFRVAIIPAKVVDIPKSTVGMGDTISSSAFVTENALYRHYCGKAK